MRLGLVFLISVALAAWALFHIWGNREESTIIKLLWSLLVLAFPFVGTLIWYFAGPKRTA